MTGTERAAPALSAAQLVGEVRARYPRPEWLCESEVTLAGRRLDVVALNLWTTRAHRIVGFEVKVSRGDWLRELAAFEKSADWHAVVDAFYVVTPGGLVKPDELPGGWGLLELRGTRMFTKVQAAMRTPRAELPREVAARFLSRLTKESETALRDATNRARNELRQEIEADIEARVRREFGHRIEHAEDGARDLKVLREALGAEPYEPAERLAEHVRLARRLQLGLFSDPWFKPALLRQQERIGEMLADLASLERTLAPAAEVPHGE